ncbi:unnamed protein product [Microthlaspi erraticum]|uniref:DUF1985 domain-containing protein n=1 Tax=Microthlaspi erraticum TaxID=1685480 RepID=A0A6D2I013_9BRAS|nr:unnamed protein product [Microthlaspi erraticum]
MDEEVQEKQLLAEEEDGMEQLVAEEGLEAEQLVPEESLAIPTGPFTRSRTKALNQAIGKVLSTLNQQEHKLTTLDCCNGSIVNSKTHMTEDSVMLPRESTGNRGDDIAKEAVAVKDNSRRSKSVENDDEGPSTSTIPPIDAGESTEPSGNRNVPESTRNVIWRNPPKEGFRCGLLSGARADEHIFESQFHWTRRRSISRNTGPENNSRSQFKHLFMLPVGRCSNSGKLIHAILARQLVTKRKYEIWSVFGGKPFRFSIREFERVSGLVCSRLPEGHTIHLQYQRNGRVRGKSYSEGIVNTRCHPWQQATEITPSYVDMLEDVEKFLQFPWGRLSFIRTLSRFGPAPLSPLNPNPIKELKQRLRQQTSACYGFPLSLQLVAFDAIPLLVEKLPDPKNTATFLEDPFACETPIVLLQSEDILHVEENPNLTVRVDVTEGDNADPSGMMRFTTTESIGLFTSGRWTQLRRDEKVSGTDAGEPKRRLNRRSENIRAKTNGHSEEGEDVRYMDVDAVNLLGATEKEGKSLRRSNKLKRKDNSDDGSPDLRSLDVSRQITVPKKKRKVLFILPTVADD